MNFDLYVITDETIGGGRSHAEIARLAVLGGADSIQLRDKRRSCTGLTVIGREIAEITRKAGAVFLINDRLDVAMACGADGVHLGQDDMSVITARQLAPPGFIIGVSVGSVEEAQEAERDSADYLALSPVFSSASKDDAGPGHGLETLRDIRRAVSIPVIAIGGINRKNVRDVIEAGADGIAVISAVVASPDITAAARELRELVRESKRSVGR
ncbi:MAG TPA: thiamine phosphate synthase [Methanoregula sp.]|nr:thiamine phosphate synthase [Methanoregula sp.]